jgi:hypothetical protein
MSENAKLDKDNIYLENIKVLVDLIKYDGKLYWDKFNVWLVLISALLIATQYAEQLFIFGFELSKFFIPFIGLITSFVWFCTSSRSRKTFNHYIRLARDIEENHLKDFTLWELEDDLKKTYRIYEKMPILKMSLIIPLAFFITFLLLFLSNIFSFLCLI